jgi:hypothetical protein
LSTGLTPTLSPVAPPLRADRIADLFAPATVVLFAGCGGTCIGIEQAYVDGGFRDRYVDLAVNHWDTAVGVHELNHPMTQHLRGDAREIDPDSVLKGRKIAYLHASPDCFPQGTMVLTNRGYRPIEQLVVGDLVLTHRGRWRPVAETMHTYKRVRTIRTHGHPGLTVSDEHPFYACTRDAEPTWTPAKDLARGHYVAAPT